MSELGGEKIDIIEWSEDPVTFIEDALSPAQVLKVTIEAQPQEGDSNDSRGHAKVEVAADQQSLAIGRGGQNVRLAAKLTGWKIDIVSVGGPKEDPVAVQEEMVADIDVLENEDATTTKPELPSEDTPTEDRDVKAADEVEAVDTPEEAEAELK
jgi:N utilization substance protein A